MNINKISAFSNPQKLSFGALKVDKTDMTDLKIAVEHMFTTPKLKQAAADTFERIDTESTKAGKDYVLDGFGPWEGDNGACIVATKMDNVLVEKLTDMGQASDAEMLLEDVVNNKPSEEEVLEELAVFEEKVMHEIRATKSVSDDFVDYKTALY